MKSAGQSTLRRVSNRAIPVLLVAYALSPFLLPPLTERKANYAIAEPRFGPFQWYERAIFEDRGHVDHLFIGSSGLWDAVQPLEVEAELRRLNPAGGDPKVLNLGHNWNGLMLDYVLFDNFLKERSCDVVYFSLPDKSNRPHSALKYVFRWQDLPTTSGMPARGALQIYGEQLLIMPRLLLNRLVRIDTREVGQEIVARQGYQPKKQSSTASHPKGFPDGLPVTIPDRPMHSFLQPESGAEPGNTLRTIPLHSDWQAYILDLVAAKAREHDVTVVFVDTPKSSHKSDEEFGEQVVFAPGAGHGFRTISIPEAALFDTVSQSDSRHYFHDYRHLNDSGAILFSRGLAAVIHQCKLDQRP
jgi:hypothetical protein